MSHFMIVATLCAVLAATANAQQAAPEIFLNINPSWSPDGKHLVFESSRHGSTDLYIINSDGSGERRLTSNRPGVDNTHPSWSPDGTTIVFDSNRDGAWNLYTIHPDGTGERRLTRANESSVTDFARHPEWSPDGRYIAFDSSRDGNGEFYVIEANGTGLRRVTNTDANDSHPLWTPRAEIVLRVGSGTGRELWSIHPETGSLRRLFDASRFYTGALFSPDGRRLVYRSTIDSTSRLYVTNVDGTGTPRAITPPGRTSYEAAWSRDGSRIAFYSDETGKHEIYIANADGSNIRQITSTDPTIALIAMAAQQMADSAALPAVVIIGMGDSIVYQQAFGMPGVKAAAESQGYDIEIADEGSRANQVLEMFMLSGHTVVILSNTTGGRSALGERIRAILLTRDAQRGGAMRSR